ncbi:MAG: hypothetical protein IKP17_04845 [Oscillospiraceae bacterium]|nr:hypothetical protein [Oscillospiraceae bacterium]
MAREREPGSLDLLSLRLLGERDTYGCEKVTEPARSTEDRERCAGAVNAVLRATPT